MDIFSPRLSLPLRQDERVETERVLAIARGALAVSSLAALQLKVFEPVSSPAVVLALFVLYTGHTIGLIVLLWRWADVPRPFTWVVQIGDILWPCFLFAVASGSSFAYLIYFNFALVTAAFRWGMRETLLVTLAEIGGAAGASLAASQGGMLSLSETTWSTGFAVQIGYLVITGVLVGYLAERGQRRRAEIAVMFRVSSQARVDSGLQASLEATLPEILKLFRARELLLVIRGSGQEQTTLWRVSIRENASEIGISSAQVENAEAQLYRFELPQCVAGTAWTRGNSRRVITLDRDTNTVRKSKCFLPTEFVTLHPFKRLLVASIPFAPEVFCRVFLFEPKCGGAAAQLRFLWDLAKGVGPAFYNVYRLQGIHSRAALAERSRIAHDLHDGVAQALHALAFRLYALRTATRLSDRQQREELLELQELVQKEAQQLRHMLQHLRPIEVGPKQLAEFLSAMVERYQDDTGIVAKFICQASALNLSPATCREIASIVQEALANVHRHSGAQNVKVNLSTQDDACILTVEDDGRGFEFSGRRSLVELEEIRRGPSIIKQRTRAIGADLTVDSRPGQGARLEIRFPVQANINDEVPNSHSYRR